MTIDQRISGPTVTVPLKIVERLRAYRASQPYDPVLSQIEIDMNIALAKPASSPAGGDVVREAAECLESLAGRVAAAGGEFDSTGPAQDLAWARRLLPKLRALSQPTSAGWRDISTAPRDGTRVLLWDGEKVRAAEWRDDECGARWIEATGAEGWQNWESVVDAPLLWQPAPPVPPSGSAR